MLWVFLAQWCPQPPVPGRWFASPIEGPARPYRGRRKLQARWREKQWRGRRGAGLTVDLWVGVCARPPWHPGQALHPRCFPPPPALRGRVCRGRLTVGPVPEDHVCRSWGPMVHTRSELGPCTSATLVGMLPLCPSLREGLQAPQAGFSWGLGCIRPLWPPCPGSSGSHWDVQLPGQGGPTRLGGRPLYLVWRVGDTLWPLP